ncbi:DUF1499 domain-containing protein [Salinisphaera sp. Q1T1-3]|uniref:DUF1499 domain-containing protein n=1 Tax=Salinisphaera sp. Q1T1-3 TaxID=2321229 RepID=UPI001314FAD5|nr:DUF1499 domain-containing protein [Salinisphaera sp. Q1T1-3]
MPRPDHFSPCPSAPHCVSSQAPADSDRHIAPFVFDEDGASAHRALLDVLAEADRVEILSDKPQFVHATFRTRMGFVDDVYFIIHADRRIVDVKSASRVGYYDFGVNRRRVERLRAAFEARMGRH